MRIDLDRKEKKHVSKLNKRRETCNQEWYILSIPGCLRRCFALCQQHLSNLLLIKTIKVGRGNAAALYYEKSKYIGIAMRLSWQAQSFGDITPTTNREYLWITLKYRFTDRSVILVETRWDNAIRTVRYFQPAWKRKGSARAGYIQASQTWAPSATYLAQSRITVVIAVYIE